MERLIPHLIILTVVIAAMVWSLAMQRKAAARQAESMKTQREAVERQKHALVQVEESLAISRAQVKNQERIIALLEEIRNKIKS